MHVWDRGKQPILHDPTSPKTGGTIVILPLHVRKRKGVVFLILLRLSIRKVLGRTEPGTGRREGDPFSHGLRLNY